MTSIFYPYNENLPTQKAHDVYVVNNCASLQQAGWDLTLAIGSESEKELQEHYGVEFRFETLPLKTRRFLLPISSRVPFFRASQRWIETHRPDMVISSVFRQGEFHHQRKLQGITYVYEVHELFHAPGQPPAPVELIERERRMLAQADLVVTTTRRLTQLLREPPYSLKGPIETIPLAIQAEPLPEKSLGDPLVISYVGQLYPLQGVDDLLQALCHDRGVVLQVIGGPASDVERLRDLAKDLGVEDQVRLAGFVPPGDLRPLLEETDAFVMPSRKLTTLPHIAHTKILEYASWGRPLLAPQSPVVTEHLTCERGVLFYKPDDSRSLAATFERLRKESPRLGEEIRSLAGSFSWERRAESYSPLLERYLGARAT